MGRMAPCRFIVPKEKDTKIVSTISRSLFSPLVFMGIQILLTMSLCALHSL